MITITDVALQRLTLIPNLTTITINDDNKRNMVTLDHTNNAGPCTDISEIGPVLETNRVNLTVVTKKIHNWPIGTFEWI